MASRMMSDLGTREDAPEFGPIFAANLRESVDAEAAAQWLDDLYESTDVTGLLSQIQAPTLILHRKDETLFPFAGAEAMAAGIHGARLITLRGSGPISIGADADANMQLVIDFLNEDRPATT